ncbi:MAG: thioredoxin domain-containing protein [Microscillaceae bacterium]|nr:thioredoxin domain-containing protein [Microscillaceae bacterium]
MRALAKIDQFYKQILRVFNAEKKRLIKQLIIIKMHADWCEASKMIAPKYTSLKNKFEGNAILFLELDLTDPNQAAQWAATLKIYNLTNHKETGQILVIDGENRFVLDKLHKNMLFSDMVKSVQKYLG